MDKLLLTGRIEFEPENVTKKHHLQASWKHVAMILFEGDVTEYYAWFINKRYNLVLNRPLRGGHVSLINDSFKEMSLNGKRSMEEVNRVWNQVKKKWDGIEVPVILNLEPRFNKKHWWLKVPDENRDLLQGIRNELGLGKPYYGFHMSIGYANEKNIFHHEYITRGILNGLIN